MEHESVYGSDHDDDRKSNKEEHSELLNLLEVQREILNNFDLVDFLDDDGWPVQYADSQIRRQ